MEEEGGDARASDRLRHRRGLLGALREEEDPMGLWEEEDLRRLWSRREEDPRVLQERLGDGLHQ